jgi:hypothetical protein
MVKLLVIKPDGSQGVISIETSGSYYDQSKVIWDERVDGKLEIDPASLESGMTSARIAALREIDSVNDDIVNMVIGRRDTEYLMAEKQAQAYIDAGYKGDTFPYVDSWAKAKESDQKWAADNIIETATNWRTIQADVRANRLRNKELVRNTTTEDEIAVIMQSWYAYVAIIKTQLGI